MTVSFAIRQSKPLDVGAVSRLWVATGERSGLLTHIATTESVSLLGTDENLTAFLELERVTHEWAVGGAAARLATRITKNGFSYEYGQFAIKNRRLVTVHRHHHN